jgi:pimeloyl-ACP methyl ester carboxylesterase
MGIMKSSYAMNMTKKIYILHGWTYSLDKWQKFSNLLKQAGFDPVFLQIPGLTEKSDEIWNIEKYSKWLGDKIGSSKAVLLGHSNGGRIAAYFTSINPKRVEKLILIDSAGIYHKDIYIQIKRFVFGTLSKVGKKITSSDSMKNFLYFLAGERDYQKATPNMKLSMVNLSHHDLTPFLEKITVPTLIIWGKDDRITPVADGKIMQKLIKNSKLKVIDSARHSPFFTHPKEVIKIIKNDF